MAIQRGRASAVSLDIVPPTPGIIGLKQRPPVPDTFPATSQEAKLWREIVNAEAADWFNVGDLPLLEAYCRAFANYRRVTKEAIGAPFVITGAQGGHIPNPIYRVQDTLAKQMAALASKLRLAQSSRVTGHQAKGAATKNARLAGVTKPWEQSA